MKIPGARLTVCSPNRNFATLKTGPNEGLSGLGDAGLNGSFKTNERDLR